MIKEQITSERDKAIKEIELKELIEDIKKDSDYSLFKFMDAYKFGEKGINRIHDWEYVFSYFFGCNSKKEMREKYSCSGVYFLNGMYIGRANNIKDRVKRHIIDAINSKHNNHILSKNIQRRLLFGEPMELMIISDNEEDEFDLINKIGKNIKLCNVTKKNDIPKTFMYNN